VGRKLPVIGSVVDRMPLTGSMSAMVGVDELDKLDKLQFVSARKNVLPSDNSPWA